MDNWATSMFTLMVLVVLVMVKKSNICFALARTVILERLIKLWTNFAKFGNPTPESSELLEYIIWPQLSTNNGDFLYLDIGDSMEVKNHPLKTYNRWNELYNSLGYDDLFTY
ncbi:COesterase domain containing protein [Asbolus verrucosus]|uniref:COesterase domain containing protein n=1 Tax=Asbolus verrucosus TaxID=1661398 RepID=A0A482VIJ1_ASBVE|nr:COesterase domain containing protein [Asbolus verrucosus]